MTLESSAPWWSERSRRTRHRLTLSGNRPTDRVASSDSGSRMSVPQPRICQRFRTSAVPSVGVTGVVYLAGGGTAADEAPLWHEMLKRNQRLLYWPFALTGPALASAQDWLTGSLNELGLTVELETWTSLEGRDPFDLASFELLFVGGGNTFRLLDHIRKHRFVDAVRDFVASGRSYYGGSAGAVLACDDIAIAVGRDLNSEEVDDFSGLGLVHGVAVLPHFDVSQTVAAEAFARTRGVTVLGMPEGCGVIVCEGVMRSIGRHPLQTFAGNAN
jgi:dipeptidase E